SPRRRPRRDGETGMRAPQLRVPASARPSLREIAAHRLPGVPRDTQRDGRPGGNQRCDTSARVRRRCEGERTSPTRERITPDRARRSPNFAYAAPREKTYSPALKLSAILSGTTSASHPTTHTPRALASHSSHMTLFAAPLLATGLGLRPLDYVVVLVYLSIMLLIGAMLARRQSSLEEFSVGGRQMPWWAVGMSMIATMMSTISYLGTPGEMIKHGAAQATALLGHP